MTDEFIHWPKPYLLLLATWDEIISWMIDILMKNHLISGSFKCNIVNLHSPNFLQEMTNYVELTFSVGTTIQYHGLQLVLSKTIRIGNTKYHMQ